MLGFLHFSIYKLLILKKKIHISKPYLRLTKLEYGPNEPIYVRGLGIYV